MPVRKSADAAGVARAAENGEEVMPIAKASKGNSTEAGVEVLII